MVKNNTKVYEKMKNKSSLSIEKNIVEWEKMPYYSYNDLESSFDKEYKDVLKNQFWGYKFALES